MNKQEIIHEIGKKFLSPFENLRIVFALTIIASFFVFIWFTLILAFKVFLTGLVGFSICNFICNLAKKEITKAVEQGLKDLEKPSIQKSKFLQKLEELNRNGI
jgi:hypothetical protein